MKMEIASNACFEFFKNRVKSAITAAPCIQPPIARVTPVNTDISAI